MVARLEGDHRGSAGRPVAGRAQSNQFGVRTAGRFGGTHAGDITVGTENDRPHRRIGIGTALDHLRVTHRQRHGRGDLDRSGHTRRWGEAAPA